MVPKYSFELLPCRLLFLFCLEQGTESIRPSQRVKTDFKSINVVFQRHHLSTVFPGICLTVDASSQEWHRAELPVAPEVFLAAPACMNHEAWQHWKVKNWQHIDSPVLFSRSALKYASKINFSCSVRLHFLNLILCTV